MLAFLNYGGGRERTGKNGQMVVAETLSAL
jgi:hypothetical protein